MAESDEQAALNELLHGAVKTLESDLDEYWDGLARIIHEARL